MDKVRLGGKGLGGSEEEEGSRVGTTTNSRHKWRVTIGISENIFRILHGGLKISILSARGENNMANNSFRLSFISVENIKKDVQMRLNLWRLRNVI